MPSRKFNTNRKFLVTAEAYFVCHIGPIFQIALHRVSVIRDLYKRSKLTVQAYAGTYYYNAGIIRGRVLYEEIWYVFK